MVAYLLPLGRNCCYFVISVFFFDRISHVNGLTVATYNLWNIMFNWEIRKLRVVEMIKETNPDIIAFQEVRMDAVGVRSQLLELQDMLADYHWMVVQPANEVQKMKHTYWKGWEREGIGMLSKLAIIKSTTISIPYMSGPDTNQRIALHAIIGEEEETAVNVLTVHFSYDRQQQCNNAARIMNYISEKRLDNVILLGDFNTYSDFEWPLRIFTDKSIKPVNLCYDMVMPEAKRPKIIFSDVWQSKPKQTTSGLTFSNMPTPGYESRPDRILVSKHFQIVSSSLLGNGIIYREKFKYNIYWNRLKLVISSSYNSFRGIYGYSCIQDCGPRGSCRCGVCVNIGNDNNCLLIDCDECNSSKFAVVIIFVFIASILIVLTLLAILQLLLTTIRSTSRTFCCLCNPRLYYSSILHSKFRVLQRLFPFIKSPMPCLLFCFFVNLIFLTIASYIFS